jgi:hypothetical protein
MGLQEQIAEAIIIAFDDLGGDPQSAVNAAIRHDTVNSWLTQETAMAAVAGGVEMAIPGLHALTIPAGIAYMMHKMAYLSWGIGAIKNAYIVETAQNSDLRNILTLWANDNYYNAHILDHMAIGMDSFEYALSDEGFQRLEAALKNKDDENVVVKSLTLLQTLILDFGGDERAQKLVRALSENPEIGELVVSAKDRVPKRNDVFTKEIERRISTKLALKVGARISARVPARLAMGFIPFAGPIVNAFFNAQTILSIADSAQKYYDNQISREALTGETSE